MVSRFECVERKIIMSEAVSCLSNHSLVCCANNAGREKKRMLIDGNRWWAGAGLD